MCNPWKKTFTLTPLVPLTMFSPHGGFFVFKNEKCGKYELDLSILLWMELISDKSWAKICMNLILTMNLLNFRLYEQ